MVFFLNEKAIVIRNVSQNKGGTNAGLEQTKNNLQNRSDTKVLYVTKGFLKNLARMKNVMRTQIKKNDC